jgi:hypothetical protein
MRLEAQVTRKKPKRAKKPKPTWQTATGEVILLKDMRDEHLRNAHRMLRRISWIGPWTKQLIELEAELKARNMEPLPVFNDSIDEALHLLKRVRKAAPPSIEHSFDAQGDPPHEW